LSLAAGGHGSDGRLPMIDGYELTAILTGTLLMSGLIRGWLKMLFARIPRS
jgi:hypothetical protein